MLPPLILITIIITRGCVKIVNFVIFFDGSRLRSLATAPLSLVTRLSLSFYAFPRDRSAFARDTAFAVSLHRNKKGRYQVNLIRPLLFLWKRCSMLTRSFVLLLQLQNLLVSSRYLRLFQNEQIF